MKTRRIAGVAAFAALLTLTPAPARAADDFPEITAAERELTQVPGEENAPAVVMFKNGELQMLDPSRQRHSSLLRVKERIKILTPDGVEHGEQEIQHSQHWKLTNLKARTVLPDGSVVPVPEDAIFRRESSKSEKFYVTSLAFPSVEPGAILDLAYDVRFDGYFIGAWLFQSELPTLHSEVVYLIPPNLGVQPWGRTTFQRQMQNEVQRTPRGSILRVWMDELPGIPDEPYSYPEFDLSSVFFMTAQKEHSSGMTLFTSWPNVCDIYEDWYYRDARKKSKQARARAKSLAAGASDALGAATSVFRFVRDEIATKRIDGISLVDRSTADKTLEQGEGDYAEKALLLQVMLQELGIDARLVWVRHRSYGTMDTNHPDPNWFDEMIVQAVIEGRTLLLDPSDKRLAFGRTRPGYEDMPAIVHDPKRPETITIPATPYDRNVRRAEVALTIDDDGRTSGSGTLTLEGHHAWRRLNWKGEPGKTADAWREWLEDSYPGYVVADVGVEESVADSRVIVRWTLAQLEEEVLGDEVSLHPSRPLGPVDQAFTLPSNQRRTPVLLAFPDRDVVKLTVRWPEDWEADVLPSTAAFENKAGALAIRVQLDPAGTGLDYERTFDTTRREFQLGGDYGHLWQIYGTVGKHDAQTLVVLRP